MEVEQLLRDRYARHVRKYCEKHGLSKEYNKIHNNFDGIVRQTTCQLSHELQNSNRVCNEIGKKYDALFFEDVQNKIREKDRILLEIEQLKKQKASVESEIDLRRQYYDKLSTIEKEAVNKEFKYTCLKRWKAIGEKFEQELKDVFGNV